MEYTLKDSDGNKKKSGSKKRGAVRDDMDTDETTEVHVDHG